MSAPIMNTEPVMVAAADVIRTFGHGGTAVHALRGVSFDIPQGQLTALSGRSGSGKTTLLNIVGGLDTPTSGTVRLGDRDLTGMTERDRMLLRHGTVSFIFQSFGLIPILSAAENVGIHGSARTNISSSRAVTAMSWKPTGPTSSR